MQDVNECADGVRNECDLVIMDECMQNVNLPENFMQSDKIKSKDPHSVSNSKTTVETRPMCRVKYRVEKNSGGKFSLTAANGDPDIQRKSENIHQSSSTVKTNLEFFKLLENSISTSTSSIPPLNTTPGKRKLAPVVLGEKTPVCILDKVRLF